MTQKIAINDIRRCFEERGYHLLSTEYVNTHTPLTYLCPKGHEGKVRLVSFKRGSSCPKCYKEGVQPTFSEVRNLFEERGCKLLSTEYHNNHSKLRFICPRGHQHSVSWTNFVHSNGICCPECEKEDKRKDFSFIKSFFRSQGYDLLSSTYSNSQSHLRYKCPVGHEHSVTWANFYSLGSRCPQCFNRQSKNEKEIIEMYSDLTLIESDRTVLQGKKELDLYFPDQKVAIEYCGLYWHGEKASGDRITPRYHRDKMDECQAQGIHLLTIFEDEWILHREICISRINNALGICPNRIYARKCEVRQIDKKEAKEFLNRVHLQGYGRCKIPFGLYHQGKLVQVMTWGSPARAHTAKGKKVLEMKRFAGEIDTVIIGGAGKLFRLGFQYAKDNGYDSLKSYCDLRWGTGNLYAKLGFTKTYETRYTPHYTDGVNRYRNQVLAQNKNKTGKTEAEVAMEKGLWKIYDCGHSTWEYEI